MKNITLRNISLVMKKELKHYLETPHSYILIAIFLLINGYFFAQPLFLINQANLNALVEVTPLILTFFIPAITMKLIAEERKTQTIEILLTLPLTEEEIIIGKYLSAVLIMLISIVCMFVYALTLILLAKPDYGHIIGTYLSIFATSSAFASISLFASTLSSSHITAFIIGFAISFVLYLAGKITFFLPIWLQQPISYLGVDMHISNISRGVLDLKDLVYYISIIGIFLYLSVENIKRIRR